MNVSARPPVRRPHGFSLVELLIGMALGLVVVSSAVTVFSGSRKSIELNTALTDIQDNARFAMDTITRDIRMSGFQGCVDINTAAAKIIADDSPTDNFFTSALTTSVVQADGSWTPAEPTGFTIPDDRAKPIPGTHALSVQFGSPETYTFQPLPTIDADIILDVDNANLVEGDLALISNCQIADIFQITIIQWKNGTALL